MFLCDIYRLITTKEDNMGTRHLTAVMHNKEYKVAQYGQWDGYLSGQGMTVLNFLRDDFDREKFVKQVEKLHWITNEEIEMIKKNHEQDWTSVYPYLSRDMGGKILKYVQDNELKTGLKNSIGFVEDNLMCEYAYVIDLDKNAFEVYKGFQERPLEESERFYKENPDKDGYYPVKMIACYELDKLPTDEEFLELENDDD